jgi:DNA replicative helicase MCM subunit Mcm2 (Cdc46/Mcm family)
MIRGKAYLLVKCPNCGFYSIAPINQKTRLCVRCGKTITIDHFHSRRVEGFEDARRLLGELNSKVGTETKGEPQSLQITKDYEGDHAHESRKGLLRTFREDVLPKFTNKDVEVSKILEECEKLGVTREYAQKLLKKLMEDGQAYQPKKDWIRLL